MTALAADPDQIGRFVQTMFRHADEGTFASLRSFTHNAGDKPVEISGVEINGEGLAPLIQIAIGAANRAARYHKPAVFAPPVATFTNRNQTREVDLANGVALSVEIDAAATEGLALLRGLLGPPTVVVASGGEWTDPATGEVQQKLHGHWRLSEPTRTAEDHGKLKQGRRIASALVGGDATNIPAVHPIRWPGSVHRKGEPKLANIVELNEEAEIDLGDALDRLEEAAKARGISTEGAANGGGGDGEQSDTPGLIAQIMAGAAYIAPLTALSARYAGGGMTRPKIVGTLEGLMMSVPMESRDGGQPGRWQSRFDGIPRMAASAIAKFGPKAEPETDDGPSLAHGKRVAEELLRARAQTEQQKADAAGGWPEPIDILADPHLTGLATVDETCLPASILALARAEGARLQTEPCHVAALAIGACSAVTFDKWRIQLKVNDRGWTQHPSIWVAVVAESGRKKTDSFRSATRGIFKIESTLRQEHQKAMAKHLEEHARWAALAKKDRGPEPKPPAEVRIATDDFTPEVLSDLLQVSDKVLLRSDELATVLGAYERYQKAGSVNAGRAHMLALYDGGPRRIDRVVRGKMFVENWSAVPVGHIQPAKVRQLVDGLSDDGLLQRFMIVMPPRADQGDPDDDDIATDWQANDQFVEIVKILFELRPPETQAADGKLEVCVVEAGRDVHPIRRRLFRLVERIEADPSLPAPLKEATSKWRGLLARLSLLFHCMELAEAKHAGRPPDPQTMRALKASTVAKACNFIMRIVVPSTFRFHTEIGSTGLAESHARWIAGYLLSRKLASITARDVGRAYREIRGQKAEIVAAMELLDHAGWVQPHPQRPRDTAWLVNPRAHQTFTEQAMAEKARRDAVREQVRVSIAELTR